MPKKKKKYYAVACGAKPGIYNTWYGHNGAQVQVDKFKGAVFKGFYSKTEALTWIDKYKQGSEISKRKKISKTVNSSKDTSINENESDIRLNSSGVIIYTDGGALKNPGPGGYGAVLMFQDSRLELSEGFRLTTNNRMELTACIAALKKLKHKSCVSIHTDSKYVVNGIMKGWAKKWRKNGWMRTKTDYAENADLWAELLKLCENHNVDFIWVKGHAGNVNNEFCDKLATQAARKADLLCDVAYETDKTTSA